MMPNGSARATATSRTIESSVVPGAALASIPSKVRDQTTVLAETSDSQKLRVVPPPSWFSTVPPNWYLLAGRRSAMTIDWFALATTSEVILNPSNRDSASSSLVRSAEGTIVHAPCTPGMLTGWTEMNGMPLPARNALISC